MKTFCAGLLLLGASAAWAQAPVPVEDRTSREQAIQNSQRAATTAYRELQQAQYESKLAEQDFLNAQEAQRSAQKLAD